MKLSKVMTLRPNGKWVNTTPLTKEQDRSLNEQKKKLFDGKGNFRIIGQIIENLNHNDDKRHTRD